MQQIQIIQDSDNFTKEIADHIKSVLLPELAKKFKPKEPEEYLTRKELATMLKVDISTIHNWSKSGKLNPIGIGARVYYRRSEIESAFVELNKI